MKFLTLLFLFFVGYVANASASGDRTSILGLKRQWNTTRFFSPFVRKPKVEPQTPTPQKGRSGSRSRISSSGGRGGGVTTTTVAMPNCVDFCINIATDRADVLGDEYQKFVLEESEPFRFLQPYNVKMMEKHCSLVNSTLDCIQMCRDSPDKAETVQRFSYEKYICIDSGFLSSGNCYNQVYNQLKSTCDSNSKCESQKTAFDAAVISDPDSRQEFQTILTTYCQYQKCYHDCQKSKIIGDCGVEADKAFQGMMAKTVEITKEFITFVVGSSTDMPDECQRLIEAAIPFIDE